MSFDIIIIIIDLYFTQCLKIYFFFQINKQKKIALERSSQPCHHVEAASVLAALCDLHKVNKPKADDIYSLSN